MTKTITLADLRRQGRRVGLPDVGVERNSEGYMVWADTGDTEDDKVAYLAGWLVRVQAPKRSAALQGMLWTLMRLPTRKP